MHKWERGELGRRMKLDPSPRFVAYDPVQKNTTHTYHVTNEEQNQI